MNMPAYRRDAAAGPQPREKAGNLGVGSLSDIELIALLIGWGARGSGVLQVAEEACRLLDGRPVDPERAQKGLPEIRGLGTAKSLQIAAALELGRRRYSPSAQPVQGPEDVWNCIRHYGDRKQEYFFVLCLNGAHELIAHQVVTQGLVNRSLVHPREVYAPAIEHRSAAVVVAHNHPSGNLRPSPEDLEVTRRLKDAGELLGIQLLDHLIFSREAYISLRETGQL